MSCAVFPATPPEHRGPNWSAQTPQIWNMTKGSLNLVAIIGPVDQQHAIETATLLLGHGLRGRP